MKSVAVALDWKSINWLPTELWTKHTLPKLIDKGLKKEDLKRCVYVIRLAGNYCV